MVKRVNLNAGQRLQRNRVRSRGVGTQNAVVESHCVFDINAGSPGGTAAGAIWKVINLDPFGAGQSVVAAIAGSYEFFRIRSASVSWTPNGGSTILGSVECAFIDNPETQLSANSVSGGTLGILYSLIRNAQGHAVWSNAYEAQKTWNQNRVHSRPWYSCNLSGNQTLDYDRSVPTTFALVGGTATTVTSVAELMVHVTYEFNSLGNTLASTLMGGLGAADVVPRLLWSGDAESEFPPEVELVSRQLGSQRYLLKAADQPKPLDTSCNCGRG